MRQFPSWRTIQMWATSPTLDPVHLLSLIVHGAVSNSIKRLVVVPRCTD